MYSSERHEIGELAANTVPNHQKPPARRRTMSSTYDARPAGASGGLHQRENSFVAAVRSFVNLGILTQALRGVRASGVTRVRRVGSDCAGLGNWEFLPTVRLYEFLT